MHLYIRFFGHLVSMRMNIVSSGPGHQLKWEVCLLLTVCIEVLALCNMERLSALFSVVCFTSTTENSSRA